MAYAAVLHAPRSQPHKDILHRFPPEIRLLIYQFTFTQVVLTNNPDPPSACGKCAVCLGTIVPPRGRDPPLCARYRRHSLDSIFGIFVVSKLIRAELSSMILHRIRFPPFTLELRGRSDAVAEDHQFDHTRLPQWIRSQVETVIVHPTGLRPTMPVPSSPYFLSRYPNTRTIEYPSDDALAFRYVMPHIKECLRARAPADGLNPGTLIHQLRRSPFPMSSPAAQLLETGLDSIRKLAREEYLVFHIPFAGVLKLVDRGKMSQIGCEDHHLNPVWAKCLRGTLIFTADGVTLDCDTTELRSGISTDVWHEWVTKPEDGPGRSRYLLNSESIRGSSYRRHSARNVPVEAYILYYNLRRGRPLIKNRGRYNAIHNIQRSVHALGTVCPTPQVDEVLSHLSALSYDLSAWNDVGDEYWSENAASTTRLGDRVDG